MNCTGCAAIKNSALCRQMEYGGTCRVLKTAPGATEGAAPSGLIEFDLLGALREIKAALYATGEFDNYECSFGHALGKCQNDGCIHCRVKRALDAAGT